MAALPDEKSGCAAPMFSAVVSEAKDGLDEVAELLLSTIWEKRIYLV
jgi:hypothetical protein